MDPARLERFVTLERERRDLEAQLKTVAEQLAVVSAEILDDATRSPMAPPWRVNGLVVYVRRDVRAGPNEGDYAALNAALRCAGLEDLIQERPNPQTLAAFVREQEALGNELPTPLKDSLKISEIYSVRTRKV